MANSNTINAADGYFKEDLDIEVGSFSLDMLEINQDEDEEELIPGLIKTKKRNDEDEDDE